MKKKKQIILESFRGRGRQTARKEREQAIEEVYYQRDFPIHGYIRST